MEYRAATRDDIEAITALHADNWRRNYRGVYSDEYLDSGVYDDRYAVWSERLARPSPLHHTLLAEDSGVLAGFVHTMFDEDPEWGSLLDNLHVAHAHQRQGLGTKLMAKSAAAVLAHDARGSLYLWVLEKNTNARAFYEACGGVHAGSEISEPPGGGAVVGLRYVWSDPAVLL